MTTTATPQVILCDVLRRSGSRVVIDTPFGPQEVNMGWFSSRFTYIGSAVKTSAYMRHVGIPFALGQRMTRKQSKCEHVYLAWDTPWRFSILQAEGMSRLLLCPKCGLSLGLRLE